MKTSLSLLFIDVRRKLGLSQTKMAEKLGCSRVSLSHYEQGKMIPGGDKVEKLIFLQKSIEGGR